MTESMNIAVVGHVDHGKSSLLGRYAYEKGILLQSQVASARKLVEQKRVAEEHFFALLVHRTPREGLERHTELPSWIRTIVNGRETTLIDTPGHHLFHKSMVHGIYQSDAAVLVVRGRVGPEAQTVDVLHILRNFGIPLLGVVISRMDEDDYDQAVFTRSKHRVEEILALAGVDGIVPFIPSSALQNEGVVGYSKITWAHDMPTFEDLLRGEVSRDKELAEVNARFVFRRAEIFDVPGAGTVLVGTVESGRVRKGDRLAVEPISSLRGRKISFRVKSIELAKARTQPDNSSLDVAEPRQVVGLAADFGGIDFRGLAEDLRVHGLVAGPEDAPPSVADRPVAELLLVEHPTAVPVGYHPTLNINGDQVGCTFTHFRAKRYPGGDWSEEAATLLRSGEQARLDIRLDRVVAMETDAKYPRLGKFLVRDNLRIVALGKVLSAGPATRET